MNRQRNLMGVISMLIVFGALVHFVTHTRLDVARAAFFLCLLALCVFNSVRAVRNWTWENVRLAAVINLLAAVIYTLPLR